MEKPYCEVCCKKFSTRSKLKRHETCMEHKKKTEFIKKFCLKQQTLKKKCKKQRAPKQKCKKPYCAVCCRYYTTMSNLEQHKRSKLHKIMKLQNEKVETSIEQYDDDDDDDDDDDVDGKVGPVKKITEYFSEVCSKCKQRFRSEKKWKKHKEKCKKFQCDVCGRCYVSNTNVDRHKKDKHRKTPSCPPNRNDTNITSLFTEQQRNITQVSEIMFCHLA